MMVHGLAWFHRPETQAVLIAVTSTLIALGCFLAAAAKRPQDRCSAAGQ